MRRRELEQLRAKLPPRQLFTYQPDRFALTLLRWAIGSGCKIGALRKGRWGRLLSRPLVRDVLSRRGTGNGVLTEETDVFGFIFREDLAALLVAALDDDRTIGLTLTAVDANRKWPWSSE